MSAAVFLRITLNSEDFGNIMVGVSGLGSGRLSPPVLLHPASAFSLPISLPWLHVAADALVTVRIMAY